MTEPKSKQLTKAQRVANAMNAIIHDPNCTEVLIKDAADMRAALRYAFQKLILGELPATEANAAANLAQQHFNLLKVDWDAKFRAAQRLEDMGGKYRKPWLDRNTAVDVNGEDDDAKPTH